MLRLILILLAVSIQVVDHPVACADEPLKELPPRTIPLGENAFPNTFPGASRLTKSRLVGIARPAKHAELRASVSTPIVEVTIRTGARFKTGDVLVRFDDRVAQAVVNVASIEAKQTGALSAATVKLQLAQAQLDRAIVAFQRQAGSQFEVDEKRAARDQAKAEVTIQQERLASAKANLERAKAELAKYSIVAPFDGEVVQVHQRAGSIADGAEPIVTIADRRKLNVELHLPLSDFGTLKAGNTIQLHADAPVGQPLKARVTAVSSYLSSASRTFRVELEIDNADESLPAGFTVRQTNAGQINRAVGSVSPHESPVRR